MGLLWRSPQNLWWCSRIHVIPIEMSKPAHDKHVTLITLEHICGKIVILSVDSYCSESWFPKTITSSNMEIERDRVGASTTKTPVFM